MEHIGEWMLGYLRKHVDDLMRLSFEVKDRAASLELREMADECRIMVSLADINELAAGIKQQTFAIGDKDRLSNTNFVAKPQR
jgi:hypothetical protein